MLNIKVRNHLGEELTLTGNKNYKVINVSGINPASANISSSTNANFDGETFINSRLDKRNIVIEIVLEGNIERSRTNLYKYFKNKKACTLFFKTNTRDVFIEGYVESLEVGFFERKQKVQVSVICMNPYFKSTTTSSTEFSSVDNLLEFPLEIAEDGIELSGISSTQAKNVYNDGDAETGFLIELEMHGLVTDPYIVNEATGDIFKLNATFQNGDIVYINTVKGDKYVTLYRDGVHQNIINYRDFSSKWFELESGNNLYTCGASSGAGNMIVTVTFNALFEGV